MRQLTFSARGRLIWEQVPDAVLVHPGDAVVTPLVASRCDLDAVVLAGLPGKLLWGLRLGMIDTTVYQHFGARPFAGPYPFGHECIARVEQVGTAVASFVPGQLVVVPFSICCGSCAQCVRGATGLCEAAHGIAAFGMGTGYGGVLSDRLRVPFADAMLVAVPDGVDPLSVVSAADNLSDAHGLVSRALALRPGSDVLIVGGRGASVGLYSVGIALALGASEVHYTDTDAGRLALAARLGALPVERSTRGLPDELVRQYTIVIDASASRGGLDFAMRATGRGGILASAGIHFYNGTKLPLFQMYARGISLHLSLPHARSELPKVLALVASGRLQPQLVTTRVAAWDDAAEAFYEPGSKLVVSRL
jgi:threonine dehydrogenase-like Zn-dependent dehydrogenase